MTIPDSLGLSANQWQFLESPDRYVEASRGLDRPLSLESTRRQFLSAHDVLVRLNGSLGQPPRRGILLADDVGLGKTTVAALVAWVVASAGVKRGVRILAPNEVMARRWVNELLSHIPMLEQCAPRLDAKRSRVKLGKIKRLTAGSIQVTTHSYAANDLNLDCDLLIIDEAHRAKGEATQFSKKLQESRRRKSYSRVLILTATPFSINLEELHRMLKLIGGESAWPAVKAFGKGLDDLYKGSSARPYESVARILENRSVAAVDGLSDVVVRHSVDDLPREKRAFGSVEDWIIDVPAASPQEVELIVRLDSALRKAKAHGANGLKATNDPRFHVGWEHYDSVCEELRHQVVTLPEPSRSVIEHQLSVIKKLRRQLTDHSKMAAVAQAVKSAVMQQEKVIVFCHHHATARELTVFLAKAVNAMKGSASAIGLPEQDEWRRAWDAVLPQMNDSSQGVLLRSVFIDWLCSDLISRQTWDWIKNSPTEMKTLVAQLRSAKGRHQDATETLVAAATRLLHGLCESSSSRSLLRKAYDEDRVELIPGGNGGSRVLGVCDPDLDVPDTSMFLHNRQPDTVISIYNTPFGPDVLVVTDKLSEGIDLHRYCRHLIHYELDPSPIRTVQRNGRLRRVNCWAAVTGQPLKIGYPAFKGTRDFRLVQIMKKRIGTFSLLLGGVPDFEIDDTGVADEAWRNQVILDARARLKRASGKLCAKRY